MAYLEVVKTINGFNMAYPEFETRFFEFNDCAKVQSTFSVGRVNQKVKPFASAELNNLIRTTIRRIQSAERLDGLRDDIIIEQDSSSEDSKNHCFLVADCVDGFRIYSELARTNGVNIGVIMLDWPWGVMKGAGNEWDIHFSDEKINELFSAISNTAPNALVVIFDDVHKIGHIQTLQ
ncbi:MAG: hypothetical protein NXI00_22980 [Cytophagales bacterium]|nr:hypothetical protein [Cytophagales bacterium]